MGLEEAAARDSRPYWLRNLDAVRFGMSRLLADRDLGQHRGLPVTAIITMSLSELDTATGKAISGGGSLIPMSQAIRMAAQSQPYLLIFDDADGRPLYLGRARRLASADQRLVLCATSRGCTFPGCDRPAYYSQVHHLNEWASANGRTDIDEMDFGCDIHHPLVGDGPHQWATTRCPPGTRWAGRTLWHPPASVDPYRAGQVNHFHHPEDYLYRVPEFPGPDGRPPPQRE